MSALASMIVGSLIGLLAFPVLVGAFAPLFRQHPACQPARPTPTPEPTTPGLPAAAVEVRAEDLAVVRTLVRRKQERVGERLRWLERVQGSLDVVG